MLARFCSSDTYSDICVTRAVSGSRSSPGFCQKGTFHPVRLGGVRAGAIHDPARLPVLRDAGERGQ